MLVVLTHSLSTISSWRVEAVEVPDQAEVEERVAFDHRWLQQVEQHLQNLR
jgi:hypothetical protein